MVVLQQIDFKNIKMKEFKQTLIFVFFIATPLCMVNSLIFNAENWLKSFFAAYVASVPQAIIYVTIIKKVMKNKN